MPASTICGRLTAPSKPGRWKTISRRRRRPQDSDIQPYLGRGTAARCRIARRIPTRRLTPATARITCNMPPTCLINSYEPRVPTNSLIFVEKALEFVPKPFFVNRCKPERRCKKILLFQTVSQINCGHEYERNA